MIGMKEKIKRFAVIVAFMAGFLLVAFLCFYNLGNGRLADWDESRHGVSAYEMVKNRDWITTTYAGNVDYWNLKPPLSEYFIAIGYWLLGFNRWGLRLYSAIAMMVLVIISVLYVKKKQGNIPAIFALLAFCCLEPMYQFHCVRAGDADCLLICLSMIAYILLLKNSKTNVNVYIACLVFSLAFLVKSWHAGIIAVVIIFNVIISGRLAKYRIKQYLLCFGCALGPILVWAMARYTQDGMVFFTEMVRYDLLARSSSALENHGEDGWFYFKCLNEIYSYVPLILFAIVGCAAGIRTKNRATINAVLTLLMAVAFPFVFFSLAKTKYYWYVYIIYPPLILLASQGIAYLVRVLVEKGPKSRIHVIATDFLLILACFCAYTLFFDIRSDVIHVYKDVDDYSMNHAIEILTENVQLERDKVIYVSSIAKWEEVDQSMYLTIEWIEGLRLDVGGLTEWEKNMDAVLVIEESELEQVDGDYQLLEQWGTYRLIAHVN